MTKQESAPEQLFTNKDLRQLIIPLVIEQALAISVGMVDTMMIASLGEAAMSGVSLVDMINALLINVFAALATGGAVVVSQFIGARDYKMAKASTVQLILVSFAVSMLCMGVSLWLKVPIIRLFFGDLEDAVMQSCVTYFWITALSFPCLGVYNSCAAVFRSIGKSDVTMYVSLGSNILNVIGNVLFIYVIPCGVAGAAGATVFARFAAMLALLVMLSNKKYIISIDYKEKIRIDWHVIRRIMQIGVPSGIENGMFSLGRLLVGGIISTFGTVQIAANAVANNIDGMGCIGGSAMGLAMITVAGQCIGADDLQQTKYYIKKLMKISYAQHIIWNSILFMLLPFILNFYHLSPETRTLSIILIAIHNGMAMLLWPASFVFPNALRAANDVRFTMVVSVVSMFTCRVAVSYVLGYMLGMGAIGVWIAMVIDWIIRIICFTLRYKSGKWMKYKKITA